MLKLQQHRVENQFDENLMNQMKEQIGKAEEEKGRVFNELKEMKRVAEETNAMVNEVLNGKREHQQKKQGTKEESGKESQRAWEEPESSEEDDGATSDYKRRVEELEAELKKRKESEANLYETLAMQTKQLEQSKISLEESKLQIASLQDSMAKEGPASQIREGEDAAAKTEALQAELESLRSELKSATAAEENSKRAMDELALALKEVATEANQVKAKLTLSEVELEHTKGDAERWKATVEATEEKYKEALEATRRQADRHRNAAERLRAEAEESLTAWNVKEKELVSCIRRTEEERLLAQQETNRLQGLLRDAEERTAASKEENQKLRDILKQALNEANVAKEAAEIAKAEHARLQDSLQLLVQENEMLKIHEAASFENIRELKRLLSDSSIREFKNEDVPKPASKENPKDDKDSTRRARAHHQSVDHTRDPKHLSKTFSLNIREMMSPHKQPKVVSELESNKESNNNNDDDEDTLRGSIFDEVDSSDSESPNYAELGTPDESDHLDDDSEEGERNSRKRRALLRRFGDLIRRKSYNSPRKEPSNVDDNLPS